MKYGFDVLETAKHIEKTLAPAMSEGPWKIYLNRAKGKGKGKKGKGKGE